MRPSLALLAVLALSSLAGCEETEVAEDGSAASDARVSARDAATRDVRPATGQTVSPDPEGTGATLTASKSQVCPGECVELLASPGSGGGAVSYRWADELAEGAGPVRVCPQVDTTYEVSIRHEETVEGEFVAEASELSRSVMVQVAGDCQAEPKGPEIHESARELCRTRIVASDGERSWGQTQGNHYLYFGSNWVGPALVHFLPSGGMRVAAVYIGKLAAGSIALESRGTASFVIDLDAACRPISAVHFAPQGSASFQITGLAVDPQGASILTGSVAERSYDLGAGLVGVSSTGADAFPAEHAVVLAKLDAQGRTSWSRPLRGVGGPSAVRLDSAGNIALLAYSATRGPSVDLGGGPIAIEFSEPLLAKFDSSGKHMWSKRIPEGVLFDMGSDGKLATSTLREPKPGEGAGQAFYVELTSFGAGGEELWQQTERIDGIGLSTSVSIGQDGRVVQRVETSSGSTSAGTSPASRVLTMAFDHDGTPLWRQQGDAPGQLSPLPNDGLSVDRWGSVVSASRFHGPLELGATSLDNRSAYDDIYVSMLDAAGKPRWGFALMSNVEQCLFAGIDSDDAGNIAVAAILFSTLTTSTTSELVVLKLAQ